MMLDKNSQQPLYVQLMRVIKDNIQNGQYKAGDQIPTETALSDTYGVSRITVRKTIEELCAQGFLVKRQGKGTFVEMPKIYQIYMLVDDWQTIRGQDPLNVIQGLAVL